MDPASRGRGAELQSGARGRPRTPRQLCTDGTALIRHGHSQPRPPPPPPCHTRSGPPSARNPTNAGGRRSRFPQQDVAGRRGPPQRPVATQHPGISRLRVRSPRSGVGRGDLTPGITARGACRWAPRTPFPQTSGQRATPAFALADRQRRPRTGPAAPRRAMRQKHATSSAFLPSATQRLHGTRPGPRRERDGAPQAHMV